MTNGKKDVTPFLVLFQGRSGSTYLIDLMDRHPHIHALGEALVPLVEHGVDRQLAWVERFLTPPAIGPHTAVGFKTKLEDVLDLSQLRTILQRLQVHVIHLERGNSVKQAVSFLRGLELYRTTDNWALYREADRVPPLIIDPSDFAARLQQIEQGKRILNCYVRSLRLPTLYLLYENLLQDLDRTLSQVQTFLGVCRELGESACLKHTDDNLRHAIVNFAELYAPYEGTSYQAMFDEVFAAFPWDSR